MRTPPAPGIALLAAACLLVGCRPAPTAEQKPLVLVSVLPQAFFVRAIAGDSVEVEVLVPPGASPALYQPSLRQLAAASRARLWLRVGHPAFPFERAWLDPLLAGNERLRVLDPAAGIERLPDDPHVWVDPGNVRVMIAPISEALADLVPEQASQMRARAAEFAARVDRLDGELARILAGVQGRRLFVFHPAWGYLLRSYGLEQVAVEEHGHEPGLHELATLIRSARAGGARTLFVQPQFSPESVRALADEIGADVEPVDPLAYEWDTNLRHVARRFAAGTTP